jgi:hypothetical protein
VYVGTSNPPTTQYAPSSANTLDFVAANGTTYYWFVNASNGQMSTNSDIWSFGSAMTCENTPPTNMVVTGTADVNTSATLTWTPGAKGLEQRIRVSESLAEVNSGCPGNQGTVS